jgi:two-component system cell cycle sensor histidine kinase PleC
MSRCGKVRAPGKERMPIKDAEPSAGRSPRTADSKLANDQLRLALRNIRPNAWVVPVFGAILCAMFSRWIALPVLAAWWVIVTLSGLPLAYISAKFTALPEAHRYDHNWAGWALAAFCLTSVGWTSMAFVLWLPGNDLNHMIVLLVLACTLAGVAALIGASRQMVVAGLAIYGITLVVCPLQQGGPIYDGVSLLAFFYTGYLAYLSQSFYTTARDMLMLRDDKNGLIEALAKSKRESDEARRRAEAANRTKSEFLANMSHELRTPLNAIIGFSDLITSGVFVGKNVEYSGLINDSGHLLLKLINDILDLAKIEAGRMTLKESDVDLHLLITDCLSLLNVKALEGAIALSAHFAPDLPHVLGDDRALRQIVINLLSNAVKFTPAGGKVDVEARLQNDGAIVIAVTDTGTGIADEDQQRVFENFGQGRHDVVTKDRGTGLGLPIVKGLVAAHGGSIALNSQPGAGTSVTIILPATRALTVAALKAAS